MQHAAWGWAILWAFFQAASACRADATCQVRDGAPLPPGAVAALTVRLDSAGADSEEEPVHLHLRTARDGAFSVWLQGRGLRRALIRQAQAAIVLPYGFTFCISDWDRGRIAPMWHAPAFPIADGRTASGTRYYPVLKRATERMEELLRAGREFDVVIDLPEVRKAGYPELY